MKTNSTARLFQSSAVILCLTVVAALRTTAAENAETIYEDDFRANAARAFLSLIVEGNLEEAFNMIDRAGTRPRITFDDFRRFVEADEILREIAGFRILRSRSQGEVGLVDAQVTTRDGTGADVRVELSQAADDSEGEGWSIKAVVARSRFPKPASGRR